MDPDSTGLNPAWRSSLAFTIIGTTWREGANFTEIEAARQLLIQDMKILEGIAPESGAYFNEVRVTPIHESFGSVLFCLNPSLRARRRRDMNWTGRNRSSGLTTISSEPSSRSMIRIRYSSFTKVSDQMSGTQILSAESEPASNYRTHTGRPSEELGVGRVL